MQRRLSERHTQHTTSGDSTTTYTYDATTDTKPHTLDRTSGAATATYAYDASGNTTSRQGPTAQQTLDWNSEGKLAQTTEETKQTGYLYDADGQLLIRRAKGDGDTVLYLGATEVHLTVKGTTKTLSGARYYTANGQTIAVRTAVAGVSGTKLSFLAADQHGTSSIAWDASTYALTKRYTSPFGASRGTKATNWPDDKAFLGKPADDTTGLTHIGAREYDPSIGQFISVDPLLTADSPQALNGYSYADNSPITSSDPTGLCPFIDCRPRPDYENTPPGHVPGQPKKSANTIYAEQGLSYNSGTAHVSSTGNTGGDDGGWGWLTGPLDTVTNYGSALVSHPEIFWGAAETGGSMALMFLGGDIVVGGGLLCLTGIGCIAGAPAAAGGVALVGVGAYGTSDGLGRVNDGLGKALREAQSNSGASKPVPKPGLPQSGKINPQTVRYTQDSIASKYKDGRTVSDTAPAENVIHAVQGRVRCCGRMSARVASSCLPDRDQRVCRAAAATDERSRQGRGDSRPAPPGHGS